MSPVKTGIWSVIALGVSVYGRCIRGEDVPLRLADPRPPRDLRSPSLGAKRDLQGIAEVCNVLTTPLAANNELPFILYT